MAYAGASRLYDFCVRAYRVPFCAADGLLTVTHTGFLPLVLPMLFSLACFYSCRELYYPQFAMRCGDLRSVWRQQTKTLLRLCVLWAAILYLAALVVSFYYTDTFFNWSEKKSVCYVTTYLTVSVEPVLILPVLLLMAALLLAIYGELFLLLIWRFSSILALLFSCMLIGTDFFLADRFPYLPIGLLTQQYGNWNLGILLRMILGAALFLLLYAAGRAVMRKKEFL